MTEKPLSIRKTRLPRPEAEAEDHAHALAKALMSGIPFIGKPAAELLFGVLFGLPLGRRLGEWLDEMREDVDELFEHRGVRMEDLRDDPKFVDAVLMATQSALRTSDDLKRTALRNAVLNAGLPESPDAARQQMFLVAIDRFSGLHLSLLGFFHNPREWKDASGRRISQSVGFDRTARVVIQEAFPELVGDDEFVDTLWFALRDARFVPQVPLDNQGEGDALYDNRLTSLGNAFVKFITSPI